MSEGGDTTEDELQDAEDDSDFDREKEVKEDDAGEESKDIKAESLDELEVKFEPESELVKASEKDDSFEFE